MLNPLLERWNTPYETPPFDLIEVSHFKPAIGEAIKSSADEISLITGNKELPTFENTVEALEYCGEKLELISSVLFNLNSAETSKELQSAAQDISPLLVRFSNDITLNEKLFSRIKSVFDSMDFLGLTLEQQMLLKKKYRSFIMGGAGLSGKDRSRFREISEELSKLTLRFEENVLDETNYFELHLTEYHDLAGLPEDIIETAAMETKKRKKEGWVFTLNYPSYIPFMQYSEKRELREKMLKAYSSRAFHNNDRDNRMLVSRIVNLRLETAKMLGFRNYAEMVLGDRMAENPARVDSFLEELFNASRAATLRDFKNLEDFAAELGHTDNIERWDWAYFSEKLKKARYNIDDEILKSYFTLESTRDAIFGLATRLYGLKFKKNDQIPVYHHEVNAYEVYDNENCLIAILYLDFHPRSGKNGGAWMTSFREQKKENNVRIIPLISIVTNFTRPTISKPSLLTFNELTTFLHEFGHALHGLLSQCTYESLSGTNVARDFVELPSQFMQNWAYEKDWLDTWAVHYITGEKIPYEIIQRIREASIFNEGYACNRQLGFGFLDMAWHTITEPFDGDINDFEVSAMSKTELFPKVETLNMSCSFTHLFGGGYAAGYYGYKWAEVLDADAFKFFSESGVFNPEVADSFRKNILEKGETDKPMNLYVKFRGKEPSLEAFLERSGLKEQPPTP
jgi:peptidyl-dipeptidase Dcp